VLCGPSGTGKTFLLEALGQQAVQSGLRVAWFTLEDLGVLLRRHRADDTDLLPLALLATVPAGRVAGLDARLAVRFRHRWPF